MSPHPGKLGRLVFGGTLNTIETWSCSIHFAGVEVGTEVPPADPGLRTPISDWFTRTNSFINPSATLEFVKLNEVNRSDGKYTDQGNTSEILYSPIVAAAATGMKVPGQLSMAVTIHSDLARGRGSKGRFYPPSTIGVSAASNIGIDGRVTAANAKSSADSAQELLSELNNYLGTFKAVVWSQAAQSAEAAVRVSVGRVVDTQRRRRSALDEDRQFAVAEI